MIGMEDCGVRSGLLHDIMRGSVKVRGDLHQPYVQLNHVHLYFSFNQEFIITKHKTYQLYHFINPLTDGGGASNAPPKPNQLLCIRD